MAVTDIRGDLWELWIDQVQVGFATLTWAGPITAEAIRSNATGQTPVAMLVTGHGGEIRVNPHGVPAAVLAKIINLDSNGDAPAIGTQLPAYEVALHVPTDPNRNEDICFRAMCFTAGRTSDGQGELNYDVVGTPIYHVDGTVEQGSPNTVLGWTL